MRYKLKKTLSLNYTHTVRIRVGKITSININFLHEKSGYSLGYIHSYSYTKYFILIFTQTTNKKNNLICRLFMMCILIFTRNTNYVFEWQKVAVTAIMHVTVYVWIMSVYLFGSLDTKKRENNNNTTSRAYHKKIHLCHVIQNRHTTLNTRY